MSAVVIRCPTCGSTQDARGECETCHEAQALYYCPNHTPGRWLDGPACEACGARFGIEPPPSRSPAPARTSPPAPSRSVEWRPPSRATPPAEDELPAGLPPEFAEWLDGLRHESRRPLSPRVEPVDPGPVVDPAAAVRVVARGAFGCIGRLVLIVVVLVILAMLVLGGIIGLGYSDAPRDAPTQRSSTAASPSARPAA